MTKQSNLLAGDCFATLAMTSFARVVSVDVDPVAVAHARTILQDNPNATAIQADARQPDRILDHAEVKSSLDFSQPAAVLFLDNGVGLPKDLDFRDTQSLGLQLVITLVEQLEGTIELDRSGETAFKITFTEPKYEGGG